MRLRLSLACLLCFIACTSQDHEFGWIGSWGASPLPPREALGPFPATPGFSNQTIRQTIRLSAGGDRIRLRLTNEFGANPLKIGAATIARVDSEGEIKIGTLHSVSFAGHSSATIPTGTSLLSDPVDLAVDDLASLSIALYFPDETGPCTCHPTGLQTAYVSERGDLTAMDFTAADTISARAFLSGVDVYTSDPGRVIVTLGDSTTDGVGSTPDTNRRWPDRLAERLSTREDDVAWGVVNAGISGNRLLNDGAGESALARFDRDILAVPGVSHIVVFEGINDLGFHFAPSDWRLAAVLARLPRGEVSAESMIAGYRQLIVRAHSKGLRIYGATIAPYQGAGYFADEGEAIRQAINEWIRDGGEFDAVLDFDAVLRDPAQPAAMADGLHNGDFLHPSDAGYRRIGDSIDLALFD